MSDKTRKWMVETNATVRRIYFVEAENAKEAEQKSISASADCEEDRDEETYCITELTAADAVSEAPRAEGAQR